MADAAGEVPGDPPRGRRPSAYGRWLTLIWAVLPLALALPAAPCFAWAAWRLRSRLLAAEAAVYLAATVLWIVLANQSGAAGDAAGVIAVVAALVSSGRAFMVRARLLGEQRPEPAPSAHAPGSDAGWTPLFPAERLRAEGDELASAVACNGRDRHRLTMSFARAALIGASGLALTGLDVFLHVYNRSLGAGIGLVLGAVLIVLNGRWVDGPVLYYRNWGRLHELPLTRVTAVSAAKPRVGYVGVLLSAPGLPKPLRVSLRNRGYVMPQPARDHLRGWLSAPHVQWTPQAQVLFEEHAGDTTLGTRRRHRVLAVVLTVVLPLALLGARLWLAYRGQPSRAIAGAPGYRTFSGPRGKPLPLGRPWGRPCQPIRFAVDRTVSDPIYAQVAAVVAEARRDGLDVTLESRSFTWTPSSLYYVDGRSPSDTVQVAVTASGAEPPRLSDGQREHIRFGWNTKLDTDESNEDLTYAYGELWLQTVGGDMRVVRRSIRQLIALTQGILGTTRSDSGIASETTIDRFTAADVAAMKRMSGCSRR